MTIENFTHCPERPAIARAASGVHAPATSRRQNRVVHDRIPGPAR